MSLSKKLMSLVCLISFLSFFSGCSGEDGEEGCVLYENSSLSGTSHVYNVNSNNFSNGLDYCEHLTYGRDGVVIREEKRIRDGLCQRVLNAAKDLDYNSVYGSRGHSLWLHDGEKFLIKGNVNPDKIKPILDVLFEECPNFSEEPKVCE